MKNLFSVFFVFVFAFFYSQKTISGVVKNNEGEAVASASVTVEEPGNDAIIAYSITNAKGEYKVTFTSSVPKVDLKIKAFNHKNIVEQISNDNQTKNFTLQTEATQIEEVKLKTKLITKRGDTIDYDIKAFDSKADRTLADVLKKIPGIEVGPDGSILYQGDPINKFYVNGKDLMEGGYGVINNALPKDAVQKVQVLENHQPVKILQDKVPSDQAALNVVLKNKVTMTGRGEVGAGFSPLLWNVKLTPMFFGQKNQWVINYKTNNNGEAVEKEGNILGGFSRWEGMRRQAAQSDWLSVDNAAIPNIAEKRYLLNNVHFFSANLLTTPFKNKEWELKINGNYANNAVERDSYRETVYEPSDNFEDGAFASTKTHNNFYTSNAKGEAIITKNAKKGFFKNTTTWNGFWNEDRAVLNISQPENTNTDITESLSSPSGSIQNSLSAIIPVKEKLVNFMSYLSYQKDRQHLSADYDNFTDFAFDSEPINHLEQYTEISTFKINHSGSVGFSKKKWTFTPEVGLNLSFNDLNSRLYNNQELLGTSFQNDMKWNEIKPYTQVGISYKDEAFNMNIGLPINFYGIDYKDLINQENREISKTVFEPSMFANYSFASFWKVWAFANLSYNFGNFGSLYTGNILTSPRNIGNNDNPLPENRTVTLGPRLEYRNPLNNLFFNIRYGYNNFERNLISRTTIFASGSAINEVAYQDNTTESQSESAEIGKYFPKFKTNMSASFSNRDSNAFSFLVNEQTGDQNLIETKTNSQSLAFKFNNTYFSWMSVDYNIAFNWYDNRNLFYKTSNKTSGWNHNLNAFFYPIENHTVGFYWEDITTEQAGTGFRNSFFDVSYQFTWDKKKIDFELKCLNLANKDVYETISYNANILSTTVSRMNIRPRQFMFTVKFNFK